MAIVSDKEVKEVYKEVLRKRGFINIKTIGNKGYDIQAHKNKKEYYFEIKSSSKEKGNFFGCVMLTELYKAISNKHRYYFVVCRKEKGKWKFREFTVNKFIKYCTLTTPIFHYHLVNKDDWIFSKRSHRKGTVTASDELIIETWKFFLKMKSKYK